VSGDLADVWEVVQHTGDFYEGDQSTVFRGKALAEEYAAMLREADHYSVTVQPWEPEIHDEIDAGWRARMADAIASRKRMDAIRRSSGPGKINARITDIRDSDLAD
jgi:macrodomain Ter protein organizer (MatP/YcbG family)